MRHSTPGGFDAKVDIIDPRDLSRDERLERWALALERRGSDRIRTLHGTEYVHGAALRRMRQDNSALTVAYEDPVLRSAGLRDDSYGAALSFFGLSHGQLHSIVCHCHHGDTMVAEDAAISIRSVKTNSTLRALNVVTLCGATAMLIVAAAAVAALP